MLIILFNNSVEYNKLLELKGKKSYYDDEGNLVKGFGIRVLKKPGKDPSPKERVNNILHCPDSLEESIKELKMILEKKLVTKISFINKK